MDARALLVDVLCVKQSNGQRANLRPHSLAVRDYVMNQANNKLEAKLTKADLDSTSRRRRRLPDAEVSPERQSRSRSDCQVQVD